MKLFSAIMGLLMVMPAQAAIITLESSGIFENASGGPQMITGGLGTSTFTSGFAVSGTQTTQLAFSGAQFDLSHDVLFSFGTISYYNGATFFGFAADTVDLTLSFGQDGELSNVNDLVFALNLISTINNPGPTPDQVIFNPETTEPLFRSGAYDYFFSFQGFELLDDVGTSDGNTLEVQENAQTSANLLGMFTRQAVPGLTQVNSPSVLAIFLSGLVCVFGLRRR